MLASFKSLYLQRPHIAPQPTPLPVGATDTALRFITPSGKFAFRLEFDYAPGFWGLDGDKDISRFWTKGGAFGYVNTSGKVIWGPTVGSPDHAPLLGWSEQDKVRSCEGLPESIRKTVATLPEIDD